VTRLGSLLNRCDGSVGPPAYPWLLGTATRELHAAGLSLRRRGYALLIIDRPLGLRPSDLPGPLASARAMLDDAWLRRQLRQEPSDPLLWHLRPLKSAAFSIHGLQYGVPAGMHPLAEAVKLGDEIVAQNARDGRELASPLLYLLMSLHALHEQRARIEHFDRRFRRLFKDRDWKATFYELLIAAGYAARGLRVQLLPESDHPTPDIELGLTPAVFAECKAKLRYEEAVISFVERWRRSALGDISAYLRQMNAGFIVRISLHDESAMSALPAAAGGTSCRSGILPRSRARCGGTLRPSPGSAVPLKRRAGSPRVVVDRIEDRDTLYEVELTRIPSREWRAAFLRPRPALVSPNRTPDAGRVVVREATVQFRASPRDLNGWLRRLDRWIAYANSIVEE
jgi:hypothetical protein